MSENSNSDGAPIDGGERFEEDKGEDSDGAGASHPETEQLPTPGPCAVVFFSTHHTCSPSAAAPWATALRRWRRSSQARQVGHRAAHCWQQPSSSVMFCSQAKSLPVMHCPCCKEEEHVKASLAQIAAAAKNSAGRANAILPTVNELVPATSYFCTWVSGGNVEQGGRGGGGGRRGSGLGVRLLGSGG